MKRCVHPVLGEFKGEHGEWRPQRELSFAWGYSTRNVSIVTQDSVDQPTERQFDTLVDLLARPASFRDELGAAIFRAYFMEFRPEYLSMLSEDTTYDFSEADLPELRDEADAWRLVTALYAIWVHEDATVNVSFRTTFDSEHELRVHISERAIVQVWME